MNTNKISLTEKLVMIGVLLMVAVGYVLLYTNLPLFMLYTKEDHLVEWLTVLGLLMGSYVCFSRVFRIGTSKGTMFLVTALVLGLILFMGAGEEISWGQRIFGIQSPEYFKEHNTQQETNIHNLVLGGVRVNRWIFSFLLTGVLALYLIVLPLLYRSKEWARRLVRFWGVPLPQVYQTIFAVALFIIVQIMPHEKKAELMECGTAFLLYLVIAFPSNKEDFVRREASDVRREKSLGH